MVALYTEKELRTEGIKQWNHTMNESHESMNKILRPKLSSYLIDSEDY